MRKRRERRGGGRGLDRVDVTREYGGIWEAGSNIRNEEKDWMINCRSSVGSIDVLHRC